MTGPRPLPPVRPPGSPAGTPAAGRRLRGSRALCIVLAAWLAVLSAAPFPASRAEAPAVTGVAILQAGVFAAVPPQEAVSKGSRHRLIREGAAVPAEAGVSFGVLFAVQGAPAGAPVVIEAGLFPPGEGAVAQRWFVPAAIGGTAQAVASFVYGWEAAPGPWRLTLSEGDRHLAEQTFRVGNASPPAPVGDTPPQPPPAPTPDAPQPGAPSPGEVVPVPPAAPPAPSASAGEAAAPAPSEKPPTAGPPPGQTGKAPSAARTREAKNPKSPIYLLQAGVFSVRDNAYAQASRYRAKGYPGCVLPEGGGKNRRYRVIVGRFPDQDQAMEARRAFVGREGGEVMVKEYPAAEASSRLKCR